MSYIDAIKDNKSGQIHVVERVNGNRKYSSFPIDYSFYVSDPRGKFKSIYGTPLTKINPKNNKEFRKELGIYSNVKTWESDLNLINKCLAEHYRNAETSALHLALFDIESDFDLERGYAPVEDPFNNITAITTYLSWTDQLITLAVPPPTITMSVAESMISRFENTFLFEKEEDMLIAFLDIIEDADILSGWNSEGYDVPYTINRITKILSKDDTRKFCLWGQFPKERIFERYGSEHTTYDLTGRVHLDYMQLYRKFTFEERQSYSLNSISEFELKEKKVDYSGSLDQLYKHDFETFIDYNRQDVMLLKKLDDKLKFVNLAVALAHDNTILLPSIMGTVIMTDQAIINRAHDLGMIVPDKKRSKDAFQAAGAYVAYPKKGMHDWIGSVDINSLYPSAIRALNMGPDTIVGQIRLDITKQVLNERIASGLSFADAWENEFGCHEYQAVMRKDPGVMLTIDWEHTNQYDTMSAEDVWSLIYGNDQPWCLSGNGTIFTYEKAGIIPGLLADWYADRKSIQKKKNDITNLLYGIEISDDLIKLLV